MTEARIDMVSFLCAMFLSLGFWKMVAFVYVGGLSNVLECGDFEMEMLNSASSAYVASILWQDRCQHRSR